MKIAITRWRNLRDPIGESGELDWPALVSEFSRRRDYAGDDLHPGWSPARFDPVERASANVRSVSALSLDYDDGVTIDAACAFWDGARGLLHTTRKHRPEAPRFRIILPLSRPVSPFEFAALWKRVNARLGSVVDQAPKDPSRFWFVPGCPPESEFVARELTGAPLDPDAWLADPDPVPVRRDAAPIAGEIERRALAYIDRMPEAISGAGGHPATWSVALVLAKGFSLGEQRTFEILRDHYNPRCTPPWSEQELRHKAHGAANANVPDGYKIGDSWDPSRTRYEPPPPADDWSADEYAEAIDGPDGEEVDPEHKEPPPPELDPGWLSIAELMQLVVLELQKPKPERGIPIGFPRIDKAIGGLRAGNITVVGAKRGFGKTTFGNAIVRSVIRDHDMALFAGEDSALMYGKRFLADAAGINALKLRDLDEMNQDEWRKIAAAMQIAPTRPFFRIVGNRPVEWIAKQIEELGKRVHVRVVLVDYLQCIATARRLQDRRNEVTYVTKVLCDAIRSVGAAGVLFSQLKRTERTEPEIEDLKECVTGDQVVMDASTGELVAVRSLVGATTRCTFALGDDLKVTSAHVARAWSTGTKPIFRLRTRSGRVLRATANHPLRTISGWARLDALAVGQRIAVPRLLPEPVGCVDTLDDEQLRLLGYLIGDGHYGKHHGVCFVTNDPEVAADVRQIVPRFGVYGKRVPCKGTADQMMLTTGKVRPGNGLIAWLRELGIHGQVGTSKRTPATVLRHSNRALAVYLGGLWAADGSVFRRKTDSGWSLKFTNTSAALLDEVQWILLRLGVVAIREPATRHTKSKVDIASIVVSDADAVQRFASLVPIVGKKGVLLAQATTELQQRSRNACLDRLPIEVTHAVTARMVANGIPYGRAKERIGYKPQGKEMCRADLVRVAAALGEADFRELAESDILWDPVVSIGPDGEEETFDLSVPGPSNFVVGGIFAHNSGDIEDKADHILLGWKEDQRDADTRRWIKLAKNKDGQDGSSFKPVQLIFDAKTAAFAGEVIGDGDPLPAGADEADDFIEDVRYP